SAKLVWSVDGDRAESISGDGLASTGEIEVPAAGSSRLFVPLFASPGTAQISIRFSQGDQSLKVVAPLEAVSSGLVRVRVLDENSSVTPTRMYATGSDGMAYVPDGVFKRMTWMGDHYCYVPGEFTIRLPAGTAKLEFIKGFEYVPHTTEV